MDKNLAVAGPVHGALKHTEGKNTAAGDGNPHIDRCSLVGRLWSRSAAVEWCPSLAKHHLSSVAGVLGDPGLVAEDRAAESEWPPL